MNAMIWKREPLANRFRYTCGEWRIDGIQRRFGRDTFYQIWRNGVRVTTESSLAEAKQFVATEIEWAEESAVQG
jgi:hypothetical protein